MQATNQGLPKGSYYIENLTLSRSYLRARKTRHATSYLLRFIRKKIFEWAITAEGLESFAEKIKNRRFSGIFDNKSIYSALYSKNTINWNPQGLKSQKKFEIFGFLQEVQYKCHI